MKIKISLVTAYILRDHCKIGFDLAEQIEKIESKAEVVCLHTSIDEMSSALYELKQFMKSGIYYHKDTYEHTLKEIESVLTRHPC